MRFSQKPLFSVIIPTYNRARLVKRAVESVLSQTFKDFELIIIDDGSTDTSLACLEVLKPSLRQINWQVCSQTNQGVSAARNKGLSLAKAPWICFLDSDDEWKSDKLSYFKDSITQNPQYFIFHSLETWYRNEQIIQQNFQRPHGKAYLDCIQRCCIGPSTALVHQNVFKNIGHFREDFPVCEDYDFWLRASAKHEVCLVPHSLTNKYAGHSGQLSFENHSLDLYRIQALHFQLWNPLLSVEQKNKSAQSIIKRCKILQKGFQKHQNFQYQRLCLKILKDAQAFI